MLDKLKTYFVEVMMKNVGPKVSAAVMSYLITLFVAHQDVMEKMGITYYPNFDGHWHGIPPTGRFLTVEFDTLQIWGGMALVAGITMAWSFLSHHTVATVTGAPQSGDKRIEPDAAITGGSRSTDPKPQEVAQ